MAGERARRDMAMASIGLVVGLAIALAVVLMNDRGSDERLSPAPSGSEVTSTTIDREGDVIVFLKVDVSPEQSAAIEQVLDGHPVVAEYEYWDQAASLDEALLLFRDNARMMAKLETNPQLVPPSYRVTLAERDVPSATDLIIALDGVEGVLQVVSTL